MSGNEQDQVASDPWRDRLCLISDQICFARSLSYRLMSPYITMLECLLSTLIPYQRNELHLNFTNMKASVGRLLLSNQVDTVQGGGSRRNNERPPVFRGEHGQRRLSPSWRHYSSFPTKNY